MQFDMRPFDECVNFSRSDTKIFQLSPGVSEDLLFSKPDRVNSIWIQSHYKWVREHIMPIRVELESFGKRKLHNYKLCKQKMCRLLPVDKKGWIVALPLDTADQWTISMFPLRTVTLHTLEILCFLGKRQLNKASYERSRDWNQWLRFEDYFCSLFKWLTQLWFLLSFKLLHNLQKWTRPYQ